MSGKGGTPKKDEEDCICYSKKHSAESCPPVQNVTHPLRYYEFTQDEIKVLEECDKESFYQRCLPFSTLFAGITYAAIKYGLLRPNPHFGKVPKLVYAAVIGHICGRVSYLSTCDEKIRTDLPEKSHLSKVMRKYYKSKNEPPEDPKKKK